jgi:hypothetical protein
MAVPHFEREVLAQITAIRKEQGKQAKRLDALEAGLMNLHGEVALSDVGHGPEDCDERIRDRLDALEERAFGSG